MAQKVLQQVRNKMICTDEEVRKETISTCKRACDMRDELLDKINELGDRLPTNALDQLINELGGPANVAVSE